MPNKQSTFEIKKDKHGNTYAETLVTWDVCKAKNGQVRTASKKGALYDRNNFRQWLRKHELPRDKEIINQLPTVSPKWNTPTYTCKMCGKEGKAPKNDGREFCSQPCAAKWRGLQIPEHVKCTRKIRVHLRYNEKMTNNFIVVLEEMDRLRNELAIKEKQVESLRIDSKNLLLIRSIVKDAAINLGWTEDHELTAVEYLSTFEKENQS